MTQSVQNSKKFTASQWVLLALGAIAILSIIIFVFFPNTGHVFWGYISDPMQQIEKIKRFLLSFGWGSYIAFVVLDALSGMLPTPDSPIIIAGGAVFGFWLGLALAMIANIIGFVANYFIAKKLGAEWVSKQFPQAVEMVRHFEETYGWHSIVVFRITPILPFDWVSYVCGLTKIPFSTYFWASLAGNLPGLIAAIALGAGVGGGNVPVIMGSLIALALVSLVGNILLHRNSKAKHLAQQKSGE